MAPPYLSERFVKRDTKHTHCTYKIRGSHINLSLSKPNTKFLKYSLHYSGETAWNSIPIDIRVGNNIKNFKNKLIC